MSPHRFVVLGERVAGFDTLAEAVAAAETMVPGIVCERVADAQPPLREIMRFDRLYDEATGTWRPMWRHANPSRR